MVSSQKVVRKRNNLCTSKHTLHDTPAAENDRRFQHHRNTSVFSKSNKPSERSRANGHPNRGLMENSQRAIGFLWKTTSPIEKLLKTPPTSRRQSFILLTETFSIAVAPSSRFPTVFQQRAFGGLPQASARSKSVSLPQDYWGPRPIRLFRQRKRFFFQGKGKISAFGRLFGLCFGVISILRYLGITSAPPLRGGATQGSNARTLEAANPPFTSVFFVFCSLFLSFS